MENYLAEMLSTVRAADFLDIAIISVLIYLVLIWFKATASRFVFLGIIFVGLVYIFARAFQLYLSAVVLQAFFAILLIALVVIFQEELRRFFERVSVWGTLRGRPAVSAEHPEIRIIARALSELSRRKIGALVVIRGNDPLDRHLEGGFVLDGKISEALLASVFDPNSAGHDGAVIIENGVLARFGCHLPVSTNMEMIQHAGMRHAAALGIAERSDALAIVVSEERGTLSVARDEKLRTLRDAPSLQIELEGFYQEKFPEYARQTWMKWVKENSREKVIALLLALGLWFVFVLQTGTLRRDFVVPFEYRNLGAAWLIEEPKPREAFITLAGRAPAFDLLDPRALRITLDMSSIREGAQEVVISDDAVRRPAGLSVIAMEPSKVAFTAHEMISADLPIEIQIYGRLGAGLELVPPEVSPKSVQVLISPEVRSGPRKILTEPIDLGKITQTTTLSLPLTLPAGVRFADPKTPLAKVKLSIRQEENKSTEDAE